MGRVLLGGFPIDHYIAVTIPVDRYIVAGSFAVTLPGYGDP